MMCPNCTSAGPCTQHEWQHPPSETVTVEVTPRRMAMSDRETARRIACDVYDLTPEGLARLMAQTPGCSAARLARSIEAALTAARVPAGEVAEARALVTDMRAALRSPASAAKLDRLDELLAKMEAK